MAWNTATALDALHSSELLDLGMSANQLRLDLHPELVVTYELRGRASSLEEAVREAMPRHAASIDLEQIRDIEHHSLDALRAALVAQLDRFHEVTFHHLPINGSKALAGDVPALAAALPGFHASGLRSIRANFMPALSPPSYETWRPLFRAAAGSGICIAIAITIGNSESLQQRIDTLKILRDLQQDSGSIQVVLVRVHHADANGRREEEATAVDYLKTLAITRLFLDSVKHIQTDWSVMGPKVLELALRFGADDAGAIPWSQAGIPEPSHHGGESELRRIIRDAGFRPVERDALFRQSLLQ